ncbi:DUF2254 domain-containing protein [Chthonobacter rhizosphaerae]|uniref:DUF2254 domain-containing protein n=1 Tax=Chthonobacter rhizosphaerae TaxID=2735553 RepID=UPI0015EEEEA0|nr:DUF2254 domain-containing protein [Chthonobacter rhizosphaerae]
MRMLEGSLDRIRNILESMRGRLWVIPAVMCVAAAGAARAVTWTDDYPILQEIDAWWYFGGDPETARELLGTLLSGMITMTSLVISITMVVLSLAANQLGPRLIWNFIRDRQIQAVIGTFFSTIVFILVVIRSVRSDDVPDVAVTAATALVGLCLFALLFHVHKVARSIIADTVIDEVASDLLSAVAAMPDAGSRERPSGSLPDRAVSTPLSIGRSGYVQVVEYERLLRMAEREDATIRISVRPGHFVLASGDHAVIAADRSASEDLQAEVRSAFLVGSQRTPTQDVEYSIRHLVEIAVRALSPGTNDPFTAVDVVHRLGAALERLMGKDVPDCVALADSKGRLRVVGRSSTFGGMADVALNQVRQAAASRGNAAVIISLASMLGKLASATRTEEHRAALLHHLRATARAAERALDDPADRADFDAAASRAKDHLLSRSYASPE